MPKYKKFVSVVAYMCNAENNVEEFDAIDDLIIEEDCSNLEEIRSIKKLILNKKAKQKEVMTLFITEKN